MKHPQHIVAFDKEAFGLIDTGISKMELKDLVDRAYQSLMLGRRHELESDERFGQALPYIVLFNSGGVFAYQRTKLVGEERLAGKESIGNGGHIDLSDVGVWGNAPSVINVTETIVNAVVRELDEELIFIDKDGTEYSHSTLPPHVRQYGLPKFWGMINDTSDPVGRVHYGILLGVAVPDDFAVRCREEELQTIGFVDPAKYDTSNCENWSKLAVEFINANQLIAPTA